MKNYFLFCIIVFSSLLLNSKLLFSQNDTTVRGEVFQLVEKMPQFPGGEEALIEYLVNNIRYPKEAKESNIQGTVYLSFVIEIDGTVTNVKVLRGIGGGCDEEAVRVIEGMPKWTPGYQRGKPVRVQYNLPIKFVLQDDKVDKKRKSRK